MEEVKELKQDSSHSSGTIEEDISQSIDYSAMQSSSDDQKSYDPYK